MWKSNLYSSTPSFGRCPLEFHILAVWRPVCSFFFSPQNSQLLFELLFKLILNFVVLQLAFLPTFTCWMDSSLFFNASETLMWRAMSWLLNTPLCLWNLPTYMWIVNYCKEHSLYIHIYFFGLKSPVCSLKSVPGSLGLLITSYQSAQSQSNCLLLFSVSRLYVGWMKGPVSLFPQYLKLMYIWSAVVPVLLCSGDSACVTAWVNSGSSLWWRSSLPNILTFSDKSVPWTNLVWVCTSIRVDISKG